MNYAAVADKHRYYEVFEETDLIMVFLHRERCPLAHTAGSRRESL